MTHSTLTILTGGSRGMGAAIAEQLLISGDMLVCISRGVHPGLAAQAEAAACTLEQWTLDLSDPIPAASRLDDWLASLDTQRFDSVTLINNAAALSTIAPLEAVDAADLTRALRIGLEAPMLLTSTFLRGTMKWRARVEGRCKVLNISSGLGRFALASQAGYCAVKAGLDHFTRSVSLDQARAEHPARIVSLSPGVIDTDMQTRLRSADPSAFPDRERFVQMKASGVLDSPTTAAGKVLAFLQRADFGSNPIGDVRDA